MKILWSLFLKENENDNLPEGWDCNLYSNRQGLVHCGFCSATYTCLCDKEW